MSKVVLALTELPRWFWLCYVLAIFGGCSGSPDPTLAALGTNLPGLIAAILAIVQVYKGKQRINVLLHDAAEKQQTVARDKDVAVLHALSLRNAEVAQLKLMVEAAMQRESRCEHNFRALRAEFEQFREESISQRSTR